MELKQTVQTLREKASDAVQLTAEKGRLLSQIAKARAQIVRQQEIIRRACQQLGKTYYKDYITEEEPDEAEYQPLCDRISEAYQKISSLKQTVEDCRQMLAGEPEDR